MKKIPTLVFTLAVFLIFFSAKSQDLNVSGNIFLPSATGNKQIFTWESTDFNWRIGMSATPGFTRSRATSHVHYLTYHNGPGQGFAVGVNGGNSSFELTGSDHNAFFRGNVGVGTPTPGSALAVVNESEDLLHLSKSTANAEDNVFLAFSHGTNTTPSNTRARIGTNIKAGGYGRLVFQTGSAGDVTEKVRIDENGNVGIGTINPSSRLAVVGAQSVEETVMNITNASDQDFTVKLSGAGSVLKRTIIGPSTSNRFSLGVGVGTNNEYLTIINGGNVGIGTTSPNQKLTVNGTIYGKEVKVDLNVPGPDYVFSKDYVLPSLDSVQSYIIQNKHLPEVPSAKEMEANGIKLSEMNMLLLKKIEELTLYVIEQQKEVEKLKEENKAIREIIKR